nr:reverse transcriptase domain-containing protein [Tanacetum cinerariifolium]
MLFGVTGVLISTSIIAAGCWWLFPKFGFEGLSISEYLSIVDTKIGAPWLTQKRDRMDLRAQGFQGSCTSGYTGIVSCEELGRRSHMYCGASPPVSLFKYKAAMITSIDGGKNIQANVDSKLVANQVLGTYVAKEDNMIKYLEIAKSLVSGFKTFSISQVPRSKNKKADALSKIASTSFAHLSKQVLVEVLETKSITGKEVATVIEEEGPTWMTKLVNYLKECILPADEKEARKIRLKARQYELMEGILYKRSFLTPWLRCVGPLQAEYVIKEIHEGSCSMHAGPRSVVAKAIRLGYFWPTMHRDAQDMIRKCNDCQVHRPVTRHPQQHLTPITAPWSFYKWGIDIAGPFSKGPGKVKFLIVAMDYFTKWIEAKAVATITGGQVKKFVWDNIVCRFVKHPQSNGLVERANRSLREGIKARLGEGNKNWVEELPPQIGMPTYRTTAIDVVNNDKELRLNLDLLEERNLVYRSNDASHAAVGGKLGPKWEGPYEVTDALGNGAYKLRSMEGTMLLRTWNVANLKRCYL